MSLTLTKQPVETVNWLRDRPIAHRGLHDAGAGIYENTLTAAAAAMRRDYPIELDVQISGDGVPMVFHDNTLERLAGRDIDVRQMEAAELQRIAIMETRDTIPTLETFLDLVSGDVGVVIELKGREPADDKGYAEAVLRAIDGYDGDLVLMSFAGHLVSDLRKLAPGLPIGLTGWGEDDRFDQNRDMAEAAQVDFISYYFKHLESRFVSQFADTGRPVICFTVKTPGEAEYSAKFSDQPTFEGFLA